jgi:ubiquinol-cytochrome c reductase cytochrome b subunit
MIGSLLNWIDDRTGIKNILHEALYERVPGGARWRYVWGSTLVFTFSLQVITGIFLWTAYSPSAQTAWESVYYIQEVMFLGSIVRGMHHFAAQAMVILLAIHLIQVIIDGAYRAPREVNFWLGIILMKIVLGLGLTGYLLPWDQKGYYATQVSTKIMGATPVVGPQLQELAQGGSAYGHHTLTRFFAMHAGILPGLLIAFLVLHLYVFRRHGITVPDPDKAPETTFWPDQALKDGIACLAVLAVVLLLAIFKGAELSPPADPSEAYAAARPEWYFLFLFRFLKFEWVEYFGLAFGAIYVPGVLMTILILMPIIGQSEKGHRFNKRYTWAVAAGIILLTSMAFYEDGTNEDHQAAIAEAHRDGHRVGELASRPSMIPVQGAVSLLRQDPFTQGPRLFAKYCSGCHRYDGHNGRGSFVLDVDKDTKEKFPAMPEATDLADFGKREWMRQVVMNYSGHFQPLTQAAWYKAHMDRRAKFAARELDDVVAISFELSKRQTARALARAEEVLASVQSQLDALTARRDAFLAELPESEDSDNDADDPLLVQISVRMAALEQEVTAAKKNVDAAEQAVSDSQIQGKYGFTPAAFDTFVERVSELMKAEDEAFLDPTTSDMAKASGGEGGYAEAFGKPANATDLDAIIEFLVSETGWAKDVDNTKVERGRAIIVDFEPLADGTEIASCLDCHENMGEDFAESRDEFSYPDLAKYGSSAWLKSFISDPGRSQFYGAKNRMPAHADKMTAAELDLLVRWMTRDYETEVPDYPSQRDRIPKPE